LQNPSQINGDDLQNFRSETSIIFRMKKREYQKDKIKKLETNNKNKNVRNLYRGINEFKKGYDTALQFCLRICHQESPESNGTHHLLFYADNITLLGDGINTTKEKMETLL
jgi:hypothetical protein